MTEIKLSSAQIKAIEKGARSFVLEINDKDKMAWMKRMDWCKKERLAPAKAECWDMSLMALSEIKEGDLIKIHGDILGILGRVEKVQLKRVQDLTLDECKKICTHKDYKACYNLLNEDYKNGSDIALDNPFVFLYSIKEQLFSYKIKK